MSVIHSLPEWTPPPGTKETELLDHIKQLQKVIVDQKVRVTALENQLIDMEREHQRHRSR